MRPEVANAGRSYQRFLALWALKGLGSTLELLHEYHYVITQFLLLLLEVIYPELYGVLRLEKLLIVLLDRRGGLGG